MRVFRWILISISNFSLILAILLSSAASAQDGKSRPSAFSSDRPVVKAVQLQGVKSFPQSDVAGVLYTKPNRWFNFLKKRRLSKSNIAYDLRTIKRYYNKRGYLFASVTDSLALADEDHAIVTFLVDEGKQTFLSGAGIDGGLEHINSEFNGTLDKFKVGEPVNDIQTLSSGFTLRDIYHDNGYPYARVRGRYDFSSDTSTAFVWYVVAESVMTYFGETTLEEERETRRKVIMRELVNKPGDLYRRKDVVESERRLYSTGLFRYLSLQRDDSTFHMNSDTSGAVGFMLRLDERKAYFGNASIGVGREEYFDMAIRASAHIGNRNLMGTGRGISISFEPRWQILDPEGSLPRLGFSSLGKKLRLKIIKSPIELIFVEPWLFNLRMPATATLIYEPRTVNPILLKRYDRWAGEAALSYELDRFTIARLTGTIEYVNFRDIPQDQQEAYRAEGDNQIRRKVSLYGKRDTRDNILVPQHGSYSFVGFDYVGGVLGGDFSYVKTQFSWSRYQVLIGKNILASRIWLGWLDDLGRKGRSSVEDRFLLGGATTIRGYAENSLGPVFVPADNPGEKLGRPKGGRYMMLGNIEVRRPLFWRFGGTAFVDAGNTYYNFDDITPLSVAFTSGLGIQFITGIGPIRFDYGVRLKRDFDLGAGSYHLSILYAF
jgi:outer membrane protein insertion porin family